MVAGSKRKRSGDDDEDDTGPARPAPPDPPGPYEYNPGVSVSEYRQFEWLKRSQQWDGLDPTEWQARKMLGAGSFGIVGLWEYVGDQVKMPTHLVVKQTTPERKDELASESRLLHLLTSTGTDHIVKLFRAYHEVGGTGVTQKGAWDSLPYSSQGNWDRSYVIARMYLEFCGGGDLEHWKKKIREGENRYFVIPEEVLWRMLLCLAKGALVLATGSEDTQAPADATWRKICHFDIKPPNVLVGGRDQTEHKLFETLKLADFGLTLFQPKTVAEQKGKDWRLSSRWRATQYYMTPEQFFEPDKTYEKLIGAETNIWAIGAVIYRLICRVVPTIDETYLHDFRDEFDALYEIVADPELLLNPIQCPYSKRFINTLAQCLTYLPINRITARNLVIRCQDILDTYDQVNNGAGSAVPPTPPPPPPAGGGSGGGDPPDDNNPPSGGSGNDDSHATIPPKTQGKKAAKAKKPDKGKGPASFPPEPPTGPIPPIATSNALNEPNKLPPNLRLQERPDPMPLAIFADDPYMGLDYFSNGAVPDPNPDTPNYPLIFKYQAQKSEYTPNTPANYEPDPSKYPFNQLGKTPPIERERAKQKARERREKRIDQYNGGSPTLRHPQTDRRMNPPGFEHLPVPSPGSYSNLLIVAAPPGGADASTDDEDEDDASEDEVWM